VEANKKDTSVKGANIVQLIFLLNAVRRARRRILIGAIALLLAGGTIACKPIGKSNENNQGNRPSSPAPTPSATPEPSAASANQNTQPAQAEETDRRFGLSEDQRRQVFMEMTQADQRATKEAEQKYPITEVKKNAEYERALREKYYNAIAKKYKLTVDQLGWVAEEGIKKKWPKAS
jgi:acetyl-CoA acetyltransferase